MPGDTGHNEEELTNQIDELRARMDRLMKGGTSTSNSALLTDAHKQAQTVVPQPTAEPAPERTRVRDLLGPIERESIAPYPKGEDVVPFPDEKAEEAPASSSRTAERPPSSPPGKPRQATVDGSLVPVGDHKSPGRPRVSSFNDIGSAVEQELAKDNSVPPASSKKGPDLASRFGAAEAAAPVEKVAPEPPEPEQVDEVVEEPIEPAPVEAVVEEEELEDEGPVLVTTGRSRRGAIVAIWSFTGLVSATIATLHFTGII